MKTRAVILAGGQGKRMNSKLPKVLHPVCGRSVIDWVLHAARAADEKPVVVVGYERERVMNAIHEADFAVQEKPLGTGHAVMCARQYLKPEDKILVLAGDMPLIRKETVLALCQAVEDGAACAMMVATVPDPDAWAFGRILRDEQGMICGVVEQKDATEAQRRIQELCTSTYCFRGEALLMALDQLDCNNAQHEYYLTDVIGFIRQGGGNVVSVPCEADEAQGINDRIQLSYAQSAMGNRLARELMLGGVTLIDPARITLEPGVQVGKDTVIYPDNVLQAGTIVGEDCILYPGNRLAGATIGHGVTLERSVIENAKIGDQLKIGPGAYIQSTAE